MNSEDVKKHFSRDDVVCDYARAVLRVGLWESEKIVFLREFEKDCALLELGCGAGRIAHGLCSLGFSDITATDFSEKMIDFAREIAGDCGDKTIKYLVADATSLPFANESFGGAIFGFNGVMQIPQRANRRRAFSEIFRVLKRGSKFVFTTHDRLRPENEAFWLEESRRWQNSSRDSRLDEFGDICYKSDRGEVFIHSPTRAEVSEDASGAGFEILESAPRSRIAFEPKTVRDFSDECIFWTCRKPLNPQ
ncbi:MAG: class I SAM-dependent methyltransferase [Opitutales bacterium]|nr:class I SAM-dependent methyltransferase [Opitutales bacterium]